VLAGAPFQTISGVSQPGRAFIFEPIEGVWQQTARLRMDVLQTQAWFGIATAIDGDTAAVGAPGEDTTVQNAGAVYLFTRAAGEWTQTDRLAPPEAAEFASLGSSLALRGDTLVVGAEFDTNPAGAFAGAAYVFERDGAWAQVARLVGSDTAPGDDFGIDVALDDTTLAVGAISNDHSGRVDPGAAYVFERAAGAWEETAKLIASDPRDDARFAEALAVDGDTLVVGAPGVEVEELQDAGAAYVFERGPAGWMQIARLEAPDPEDGSFFGIDVAVSGETILVGAYLEGHASGTGVVHVFRRAAGLWTFAEQFSATDSGGILFGWRAKLAGARAAIAAPFYQTNRGAAYVFSGVAGGCDSAGCELGDIDGDCCVSLDDLTLLLSGFGAEYDFQDLANLLSQFGNDCGGCQ
jgi:hypothetical protein